MVALLGSGAEGDADVADALGTDAGAASHHLIQVYLHLLVVRQLSVHQEHSEVAEELLGLGEVDGDDLRHEVWGALVLELLQLQELLIQHSLVEEQGEQAIHFGPQEVHTPPQHPQWKPRFGSSLATSPLPQSERETFFPLFPGF